MTFDGNKHYGLVGVNGAGKSTIVKLMLGLYDEFQGEILINGYSIRSINKISLRKAFSVIQQDSPKFDLTLRDNIILGNKEIKDHEVKNIIVSLNLYTLVKKLVNGLDTSLGRLNVRSSDLSGGEWQKVLFARALINKNSFSILDEPTAAMDPIAEVELSNEVENKFKDRMLLIISHRFSNIRNLDWIYVLDKGKVQEAGTHQELVKAGGVYCDLYEAQKKWYV